MAKHIIKKHKSLGQRRSSMKAGKPVKLPAIMPSVGPVQTAMREAFELAVCGRYAGTKKFVHDLMNGRSKNAGVARPSRGWTADVSARTLKSLQSQGVFA